LTLQLEGIDFVKVDNQSSLNQYMGGERSVAGTAHDIQAGLEASVALHFGGCMINCMGMASENVWHRPLSSVSRSSNDFLPQIANGFGEHALQNAYNSVYHGPFYWGDWDMFWTGHHDAVPHMVLRAVRIAHRLRAVDRISIKVAPLEAELFVVVPITGSFTAIGLADKLAASDAVMDICGEIDSVKVRLKDGGMFMFVSERKPAKVDVADERMGVYRIDCPACTGETLADIRFG